MDDISIRKALAVPSALALLTLALAGAISLQTGISGYRIFWPYVSAWAAASLLSILIWVFVEVARLAPTGADRPLQKVLRRAGQPAKLILLPGLVFPVFISAYTWAKCSIPYVVGYGWEEVWADADHAIFGMDAWQWSHSFIAPSWAPAWTFFYAVIWGFGLVFSGTLVAVFAGRRFAATFFTAMMLSWLIGGILMAYAISAAGPVFAHLADPELGQRFLALRAELSRILPPDDTVLSTQQYLEAGLRAKIAVKGAGISAMPSMHIATATILVLAAGKGRWLVPAWTFLILTFVGSIYLGYHYAVDAPVAAMVAVLCWMAARRIYPAPAHNSVEPEQVDALSLQQLAERAG